MVAGSRVPAANFFEQVFVVFELFGGFSQSRSAFIVVVRDKHDAKATEAKYAPYSVHVIELDDFGAHAAQPLSPDVSLSCQRLLRPE
jgi:hypothetical protein